VADGVWEDVCVCGPSGGGEDGRGDGCRHERGAATTGAGPRAARIGSHSDNSGTGAFRQRWMLRQCGKKCDGALVAGWRVRSRDGAIEDSVSGS